MYDKEVFCDARKAVKFVSDRGFAWDIAWRVYDAPQTTYLIGEPHIPSNAVGFPLINVFWQDVSLL